MVASIATASLKAGETAAEDYAESGVRITPASISTLERSDEPMINLIRAKLSPSGLLLALAFVQAGFAQHVHEHSPGGTNPKNSEPLDHQHDHGHATPNAPGPNRSTGFSAWVRLWHQREPRIVADADVHADKGSLESDVDGAGSLPRSARLLPRRLPISGGNGVAATRAGCDELLWHDLVDRH